MFVVYLAVDFLQLFIDIMQKPLNTQLLASYPTQQRVYLNTKTRLLTGLMLVLFALTAMRAQAQGQVTFNNGTIVINGVSYGTTTKPTLPTALPGTYSTSNTLRLGGEANVRQTGNNTVQLVQLFYRVFPTNIPPTSTSSPAFSPLNLPKVGTSGNTTTWRNLTSQPNILAGIVTGGNYTLQLYFQASAINNRNVVNTFVDNSSGRYYNTTFAVTVPQNNTTVTWNGTNSDDWFDASNWSSGAFPTPSTDVNIPYAAGRLYPVVRPYFVNGKKQVAQARTLVIGGQSATEKSTILIKGGELQVFGTFSNQYDALSESDGGVFTLAGTTRQVFDGGTLSVVHIQGGGEKVLTNRLIVQDSLRFVREGGFLTTVTDNSASYGVALLQNATITGETETNYVNGILTATRSLSRGSSTNFGGIGVELSAANLAASVVAIRLTGLTYSGVGPQTTGTSVARSFTFTGPSADDANFNLVFGYLNREVGSSNTASNLVVYHSSTGGSAGFARTTGTNSRKGNSVILQGATAPLASTFTLGTNTTPTPLPVTLVSFTATPTAQGAALLRWTTATETNNKGFGIERQLASGDTWQSVGYLSSGNNATGSTYEYTDKSLSNAAFTPQAYYRLRQEDQDGKLSYSPVAVVARPVVAASTNLLLSPVPVTGASLSLTFAEVGQAGSEISIINTQGQRLYNYTTLASDDAALSLPVERLAAGVYIVSVRVPGQALRHARFVKL
jgi:hypothetical protein